MEECEEFSDSDRLEQTIKDKDTVDDKNCQIEIIFDDGNGLVMMVIKTILMMIMMITLINEDSHGIDNYVHTDNNGCKNVHEK